MINNTRPEKAAQPAAFSLPPTKTCTGCGETLLRSEYHRNASYKDGLSARCKRCVSKYEREMRPKDPRKAAVISQRFRKKRRDLIDRIKTDAGCLVCRETVPVCLCFHHLRDKAFTIGTRWHTYRTWQETEEEIRKCVVLCHNCHAKVHAGMVSLPAA